MLTWARCHWAECQFVLSKFSISNLNEVSPLPAKSASFYILTILISSIIIYLVPNLKCLLNFPLPYLKHLLNKDIQSTIPYKHLSNSCLPFSHGHYFVIGYHHLEPELIVLSTFNCCHSSSAFIWHQNFLKFMYDHFSFCLKPISVILLYSSKLRFLL